MPDGSSSAAPVINPGPSSEKNRVTRVGLRSAVSFDMPQTPFERISFVQQVSCVGALYVYRGASKYESGILGRSGPCKMSAVQERPKSPRGRVSAGLLMFRRSNNEFEVLLVHRGGGFFACKDDGAWTGQMVDVRWGEDAQM